MEWVTIRGGISPAVGALERGEVREVQFDDHVQRLINGGFVEVVEWHTDPEPELSETSEPEPVETADEEE